MVTCLTPSCARDAATPDAATPDAAILSDASADAVPPDAATGAQCENDVCEAEETVASCPWDCQPSLPRLLPDFGVQTATGTWRTYRQDPTLAGPTWTFSDDLVDATITAEGDGFYRLDLHAKVALSSIAFPFQDQAFTVNGSIADDKVYYAWLGGGFEPEGVRGAYEWWGLPYPGVFAPLLITADDQRGLIVAATNWPPVAVTPMHGNQQNEIVYPASVPAGADLSYRSLVTLVEGSPSNGYKPWQLAMERYAKWLYASFTPPAPPAWMVQNEGFLDVQLENMSTFSAATLQTLWETRGSTWSFMLLWGQMSAYAGGCCEQNQTMDPRYLPDLPNLVANIVAGGGHAGYYTREPPTGDIADEPGLDWYTAWVSKNFAEYHANSTYLDVICRGSGGGPGAPWSVAQLFSSGTVPANTVCEGFQDTYAAAALLSGFVIGDANFSGGPGTTPDLVARGTYPSLVRFLMRTRPGYLGGANGDYQLWGASHDSYVERQLFLLGAKAEISDAQAPSVDTTVAAEIADLRRAANWWERNPRFVDTAGLSAIPAGIDARRHVATDGGTLITIENWSRLSGLTLQHRGCTIAIPTQHLSIVASPCR